MGFQLALDVGGTFTDLVCRDDAGAVTTYKSPTTPPDLVEGVLNAISLAAKAHGATLTDFLSSCSKLAYGSTTGTNAIIESKGAKTGLICTRGFRDILLVREGGKRDTYNLFVDYPPPYIPRYLTLEVAERINSEGGVEIPLREDDVYEALRQFKAWKVEAIAVALLWSIANPDHEQKIGRIISEELPDTPFSLSHEVNPCVREYRRTSATAIDASLKPVVLKTVRELERRLSQAGFNGVLTHVTSSGGQASSRDIIEKPVHIVFSGPSMAPVAGRMIASAELGANNVITVDMGGTSFDVAIISDGLIPMYREGVIGDYMFGVPSVDVKSIGAGGGSIATIDSGGFIHVGPRSAAGVPGPACYMRGGTEPTVTDANVVRGFLDPDYFLGGAIKLSATLAEEVIGTLAVQLKMSLPETAALVAVACEQNMAAAIQDITVRRGIDPREYVMVAGGAATGMHLVPIARELGVKQVIVPRTAAVMSAYGALTSDVKFLYAASLFTSSSRFDFERANETLQQLQHKADDYLSRMGIPPRDRQHIFTVEARYNRQVWQLTLPLRSNRVTDKDDLAILVEDFHSLHEQVYSVRNNADDVEFVEWNVQAVGKLPETRLPQQTGARKDPSAAFLRNRPAYFKETGGIAQVPVYLGENLAFGNEIEGPAIIADPLTTVALYPGSTARVTKYGSYLIQV